MKFFITFLALCVLSPVAIAKDKLIMISPHRKSIQQEFIPIFKDHYKKAYGTELEVDWIDQGGTSDNVRFVRAKFAKDPKSAGIDVFWGGGTSTFLELDDDKLLAKYTLPAELKGQVPEKAAGVPLYTSAQTWYGSAMSSFGIFYNKFLLDKIDKLPAPLTWDDLGDPKYYDKIVLTDPRRSGSASAMNTIVLQSKGWEAGWELLTRIAGNNRKFTHSSSAPIKAVVAGDASIAMAIDFYANSKIGDLGKDKLGFSLPAGQTVLDPDPVAVLKGAPNRKVAERFVTWLLSADTQKILILPKGAPEGPKFSALGRMAINTKSYADTNGKRTSEFNPFEQKAFMKLDLAKSSKLRRPFNDLIGATLIDVHPEARKAWQAIIKRGSKPAEIKAFAKPPVSEAELLAMADKWSDNVFRNQKINEWLEFSRTKFKKLATQASE